MLLPYPSHTRGVSSETTRSNEGARELFSVAGGRLQNSWQETVWNAGACASRLYSIDDLHSVQVGSAAEQRGFEDVLVSHENARYRLVSYTARGGWVDVW